MRIKIKSVGDVVKEKNYFYVPVVYDEDGKEVSKKIFSFQEKAYNVVKSAKEGETFDVTLEKNKNGYWEWSSVEKAGNAGETPKVAPGRAGTFETSEERARRQILIVRQSSIAQAVAYFNGAVVPPELERVLDVAAQFEAWVNRE